MIARRADFCAGRPSVSQEPRIDKALLAPFFKCIRVHGFPKDSVGVQHYGPRSPGTSVISACSYWHSNRRPTNGPPFFRSARRPIVSVRNYRAMLGVKRKTSAEGVWPGGYT